MSGTNTLFQPNSTMPTATGQQSNMAGNLSSMAGTLASFLGSRGMLMPNMYQPYNPYAAYGRPTYHRQPSYWNNMAYQMAALPSYAIPRAGSYYSAPQPQPQPQPQSTPQYGQPYQSGAPAFGGNTYYQPGVGYGSYGDFF